MSALYFVASDIFYFQNIEKLEVFNQYAKIKQIEDGKITKIIVPTSIQDITAFLKDDQVAFLSWNYPSEDEREVLVVKELPNLDVLLTSQEKEYGITLKESLRAKLQLEIIETTRNFEYLAGAEEMKQYFRNIVVGYKDGVVKKITVFLLGIPGAGKTYLAECLAGELKYLLVKLDLALIMRLNNPIQKLHYFFKYIENLAAQGIYVVALLDEIANMLRGGDSIQSQFKGQMLTIMEDLNSPRGYQVGESIFIATENNIRDIMTSTPQFMARWKGKFFINFPKQNEAKMILAMHLKKNGLNVDVEKVYVEIEKIFRNKIVSVDGAEKRFIYAPREIEDFTINLAIYSKNNEVREINNAVIREITRLTPPQQLSLKEPISMMMNDAGMGWIEI